MVVATSTTRGYPLQNILLDLLAAASVGHHDIREVGCEVHQKLEEQGMKLVGQGLYICPRMEHAKAEVEIGGKRKTIKA